MLYSKIFLFPTKPLEGVCFPHEVPLGLFSQVSSSWLPHMTSGGLKKVIPFLASTLSTTEACQKASLGPALNVTLVRYMQVSCPHSPHPTMSTTADQFLLTGTWRQLCKMDGQKVKSRSDWHAGVAGCWRTHSTIFKAPVARRLPNPPETGDVPCAKHA